MSIDQSVLYTSSGVVRNREIPRVGVVSVHSLADWIYDEIDQGIDLTWESYLDELRADGIEEDSAEWCQRTDHAEFDSRVVLFGDWAKGSDGRYSIDREGKRGFSAEYNSGTGIVCVEWSRSVKACHHTSPCYVMSDGSGPCGDLDVSGDAVIAYSLPAEWYREKQS